MAGWKFKYLPEVECPSELPIEMTAFKTQQARWAKGLIQTSIKILPRVFRSNTSRRNKIESRLPPHRQPQLSAHGRHVGAAHSRHDLPLLPGLVPDAAHRFSALHRLHLLHRGVLPDERARALPQDLEEDLLLSAVPHGSRHRPHGHQHQGGDGSAVRHQERLCAHAQVPRGARRAKNRRPPSTASASCWRPWIELLFGCYFAAAIYYTFTNNNYFTAPFLILFVVGYWYTGLMSLLQGRFERWRTGVEYRRIQPQAVPGGRVRLKPIARRQHALVKLQPARRSIARGARCKPLLLARSSPRRSALRIFFVILWCAVCFLGQLYDRLVLRSAGASRRQSDPYGETRTAGPFFYAVYMRFWGHYSSVIRLTAAADALYASVLFPFRPGHPPLRIPWNEIQIGKTKFLWRSYVLLTLGNAGKHPHAHLRAHGPQSWNLWIWYPDLTDPSREVDLPCYRSQPDANAGLAVCYIDAMVSKNLAMIAALLSVALAPAARAAQTGNQAAPTHQITVRPRRLASGGSGSAGCFHVLRLRPGESGNADRLRRRRVRCRIASYHHCHSGACARAVAPAGSHRLGREPASNHRRVRGNHARPLRAAQNRAPDTIRRNRCPSGRRQRQSGVASCANSGGGPGSAGGVREAKVPGFSSPPSPRPASLTASQSLPPTAAVVLPASSRLPTRSPALRMSRNCRPSPPSPANRTPPSFP